MNIAVSSLGVHSVYVFTNDVIITTSLDCEQKQTLGSISLYVEDIKLILTKFRSSHC